MWILTKIDHITSSVLHYLTLINVNVVCIALWGFGLAACGETWVSMGIEGMADVMKGQGEINVGFANYYLGKNVSALYTPSLPNFESLAIMVMICFISSDPAIMNFRPLDKLHILLIKHQYVLTQNCDKLRRVLNF